MLASMTEIVTTDDAPHDGTTLPDVIVRGDATGFAQRIQIGSHHLQADEPVGIGGTASAPDPYEYLLAGLGACTSMTIGLYARRNKWPLKDVTVNLRHSRIHAQDCAECDTKTGLLDRIELEIDLKGELTPEQRAKLIEIAHKCPVHRTLKSELEIKIRPTPSPAV